MKRFFYLTELAYLNLNALLIVALATLSMTLKSGPISL